MGNKIQTESEKKNLKVKIIELLLVHGFIIFDSKNRFHLLSHSLKRGSIKPVKAFDLVACSPKGRFLGVSLAEESEALPMMRKVNSLSGAAIIASSIKEAKEDLKALDLI